MAIEESSVSLAASKAAKFWATRGGFKTTVINTQEKIGQVHFIFKVMYKLSCSEQNKFFSKPGR
jgi:hydroxymethylglutaryl-CoA reductase